MTVSHKAQVPPAAARHFGADAEHPVIAQEFRPGRGWTKAPMRKRVSESWLRKLEREGIETVALESGGRVADFSIRELLTSVDVTRRSRTITTPWGTRIRTTRNSRFLVIVEGLDHNVQSTGAHIERGSDSLDTVRKHVARRGIGDHTFRRFIMDQVTGQTV